jgi:hypothetical protein
MEYPREVADFLKLHPKAYPPDMQPIASRVNYDLIRDRMRKDIMPTRSSNAKVRVGSKSSVESPSSSYGAHAGRGDVTMALLEYVLHGKGGVPPKRLELEDKPRMLALHDQPASSASLGLLLQEALATQRL